MDDFFSSELKAVFFRMQVKAMRLAYKSSVAAVGQLATNCNRLKLMAADGKRVIGVAIVEALQSVCCTRAGSMKTAWENINIPDSNGANAAL